MVASATGDNWRVIPSAPRPGEKTYEARVPNGMVGLVIGRGGENIKRLNLDFGVRVQVEAMMAARMDVGVRVDARRVRADAAWRVFRGRLAQGRGTS